MSNQVEHKTKKKRRNCFTVEDNRRMPMKVIMHGVFTHVTQTRSIDT